MKKTSISLILAFAMITLHAQNVEYSKEDSTKIVKILTDAQKADVGNSSMIYFGKKFLGVPYVAHTLENGDLEHLIVNTRGLDCTTFVETVLALNMCYELKQTGFDDFCDNLKKIRYRGGKLVDYTSRLHYFTWWGEDNEKMGIVKAVVDVNPNTPFSACQEIKVNYMTKNPNLYKQLKNHPDYIPLIKKYEDESNGSTYRYIPKSKLNLSRNSLGLYVHDGDIISILTSKDGLDTSHIGMAFWQGGRLHMMHASSVAKKVIMDNSLLYDYMKSRQTQIGIRVYRPIRQTVENDENP